MGIRDFLRDIGRGKHSARDLSRENAREMMTLVLQGRLSDLQLGAFCIAMRVKGETSDEMLGFLDAIESCINPIFNPDSNPCVILPSYNGARRLPLFTPLLAMLLAQKGLRVLIHGGNTESTRVSCQQVLQALGWPCATQPTTLLTEPITYVPLSELCPGLWRLLQVRGEIGLRNSGHSMVKLMNPVQGACLQVASYTHPEYHAPMTQTLQSRKAHAMLLRGTEGEPVADPRRPREASLLLAGQPWTTPDTPPSVTEAWTAQPVHVSAEENAALIHTMLKQPDLVPPPIQRQVTLIAQLALAIPPYSKP